MTTCYPQVLRVLIAGGSSGVLPSNEGPMVLLVQVTTLVMCGNLKQVRPVQDQNYVGSASPAFKTHSHWLVAHDEPESKK